MEHMSLTLFSICLQAAIGIMVFVSIGKLINKDGIFKNAMFVAAGLGIIGLLSSVLHLGRPFKAFFALNQFASSWLSREIWFSSLFVGLTVLAVLILMQRPQNRTAIKGVSLLSAVVGLVAIAVMSSVFTSSSVPFWHGTVTFVEFYAAAISMGAILFLFLSISEAGSLKKLVAAAVAAAVIIQVLVVVPNLISLANDSNEAIIGSLAILNGMATAGILKWLCILIGAVLVVWSAKDEISPAVTNTVMVSALLLFVGQLVGRYMFYAAMVVGSGLS
ncbi:MAG TPA: DmsC/YnfH family molybdoenzyme membrane anchor subunit [Syntrophomonadaceae bacterium]|nr:DmsC/YnfH family molybdoenzyme membrane anchor subunit [Syntrophomonadaceae bacterium]